MKLTPFYNTFHITAMLVLMAFLVPAPATVSAQRTIQFEGEEPTRELSEEELELTTEEELLAKELMQENRAVNVAEQYKSLLTRDAVVIRPSERGDPMVVPFIADKVLLEQMLNRMEESYATGDYEKAVVFAKSLIKQFPQTDEAGRAKELLAIVLDSDADGDVPLTADSNVPRLDPWVKANTSSILYDGADSIVMIGFEILRIGDTVPDHPDHVVEEINPNSVIFRVSNEFQTKQIELQVSGN
jgi:hypothetical protein